MRRYGRYNNQGAGLAMLLVVVVLAVFSGYMGTKFIIEPYFLADRGTTPDAQSQDGQSEESGIESADGIVSGQQNVTDVPPSSDSAGDSAGGTEAGSTDLSGAQGDASPDAQAQDGAEAEGSGSEIGTVPTVSPATGDGLYCIQFGSFSTQEAAEKAVKELTEKDVATYVQPKDGTYKVLSVPYESREKALEAADSIKDKVEDVYVVTM